MAAVDRRTGREWSRRRSTANRSLAGAVPLTGSWMHVDDATSVVGSASIGFLKPWWRSVMPVCYMLSVKNRWYATWFLHRGTPKPLRGLVNTRSYLVFTTSTVETSTVMIEEQLDLSRRLAIQLRVGQRQPLGRCRGPLSPGRTGQRGVGSTGQRPGTSAAGRPPCSAGAAHFREARRAPGCSRHIVPPHRRSCTPAVLRVKGA